MKVNETGNSISMSLSDYISTKALDQGVYTIDQPNLCALISAPI